MKKAIVCMALVVVMVVAPCLPAFAAEPEQTATSVANSSEIVPYVTYYYVNGKQEFTLHNESGRTMCVRSFSSMRRLTDHTASYSTNHLPITSPVTLGLRSKKRCFSLP